MDFLLANWYLILIAAVSGGMLLAPLLKGPAGAATLSPADAVMRLNREKAVMLDVSEPAEYEAGHATPAKSVPFGQVEGSKLLPADKARPIVLICANGSRSRRAVDLLKKAGHSDVKAVAGGLAAWREAQLPVDRGPAAAEPAAGGGKRKSA